MGGGERGDGELHCGHQLQRTRKQLTGEQLVTAQLGLRGSLLIMIIQSSNKHRVKQDSPPAALMNKCCILDHFQELTTDFCEQNAANACLVSVEENIEQKLKL